MSNTGYASGGNKQKGRGCKDGKRLVGLDRVGNETLRFNVTRQFAPLFRI
jgi:hypothetical protein